MSLMFKKNRKEIEEKEGTGKTGFLPYGRQNITENDIEAVNEVLRSDWLTCGPAGPAFESALCQTVGSKEAIACSNGTAALHLAMLALGLGPGDVVITSSVSFLASANCARYVGAEVWFADIDPETGLISIDSLTELLENDSQSRVKAIIPVHLAGQPTDMPAIYDLANKYKLKVVEDGCHALGGSYISSDKTVKIGSCEHSDMTVFSFHPVKHVAMGEGGAITTNDPKLAERLRLFRSHGMQKESFADSDLAYDANGKPNPWYYEMGALGYNYRLSDIQAALGKNQLAKLSQSITSRQKIAEYYDKALAEIFEPEVVRPLKQIDRNSNAYHLYVTLIDYNKVGVERAHLMNQLKKDGIGTQVHYIPIFLQPFYREQSLEAVRNCPGSLKYYEAALSIPMYPELTEDNCKQVVESIAKILKGN